METIENSDELIKLFIGRNDQNSKYYVESEHFDITPVKGTRCGLKRVVNDIHLPLFVKNLSCTKHMEVRREDTFVIGYPKSGTTWIEEIVWLIKNDLNFELSKKRFHMERVRYIDSGVSRLELSEIPNPRVFKSHLPLQFLPDNIENKAKIVYAMRNPKDCVVSTYNHVTSFKRDEHFSGSLQDLVDLFLEGKYWFGPWWSHINEFTALNNVHVVHYESLLKNPYGEIRRLANYLEKDFSDMELDMLVRYTSFNSMKNLTSMDFFKYFKGCNYIDENAVFFKKGIIGNWMNYFTQEESDRFDTVIAQKLKYHGAIDYGNNNN